MIFDQIRKGLLEEAEIEEITTRGRLIKLRQRLSMNRRRESLTKDQIAANRHLVLEMCEDTKNIHRQRLGFALSRILHDCPSFKKTFIELWDDKKLQAYPRCMLLWQMPEISSIENVSRKYAPETIEFIDNNQKLFKKHLRNYVGLNRVVTIAISECSKSKYSDQKKFIYLLSAEHCMNKISLTNFLDCIENMSFTKVAPGKDVYDRLREKLHKKDNGGTA